MYGCDTVRIDFHPAYRTIAEDPKSAILETDKAKA